MRRLLLMTVALLALAFFANANAQSLLEYSFNYSYGNAYTPITSAPYTQLYSGGTYGSSYTLTSMPFTFKYNNTNYSMLYIHSTGMIRFYPGSVGYYYSDPPFTSSYPTVFAGATYGRSNPSTGYVRYQTRGTSPNRVFVIEFANYTPYTEYYGNGYLWTHTYQMTQQIRLYETSNIVEIAIGPNTMNNYPYWATPTTNYYRYFAYGVSASGKYINIGANENGEDLVAHYSNSNPAPYYGNRSITNAGQLNKMAQGLVMQFISYPQIVGVYPSNGMILSRAQVYSNLTTPNTHPSVFVNRVSAHPETWVSYKISGPLPVGGPGYKVIYEAIASETTPNDVLFKMSPQPVGNNYRFQMPSAKGVGARSYDGALDLLTNIDQIIPGDYKVEAKIVLPSAGGYTSELPVQTFKVALANDLNATKIQFPQQKGSKKYPLNYSTGIPVKAIFRNVGINNITAFSTTAKIYSVANGTLVYQDSRTFTPSSPALAIGDYWEMDFKNFRPATIGDYRIVITSTLDNAIDEDPVSNTYPRVGDADFVFNVAEEVEIEANAIVSPQGQMYINRPVLPVVRFKNNGVYDLTDVAANVKIFFNSVVVYDEDMLVSEVPSSGSQMTEALFLSNFVPTQTGTYTIVATCSTANENVVSNNSVTSTFEVIPAMSGSYTISATGTGANNFTTIQSAVNALFERGVTGPVVFYLPDATYEEGQALGGGTPAPALDFRSKIVGVSATNTITFRPSSARSVSKGSVAITLRSDAGIGMMFGQSMLPTNTYAAVNTVNNALLKVYAKSAGYIIWDGGAQKSFKLLLESNSNFRAPIYIADGSENISIKNCIVGNKYDNNTSKTYSLPLTGYNANVPGFTFEDNEETSRSYSAGILLRNKTPYDELSHTAINRYALDTVCINNIKVENNEITGFGYGIASMGIGALLHTGQNSYIRYYNKNNTYAGNTINNVARAGIFLGFEENSIVTGNRIYNIPGVDAASTAGILLGGQVRTGHYGYNNINLNITANEISQLYSSSDVYGIYNEQVSFELTQPNNAKIRFPNVAESITIANNSIWGLSSSNATTNRIGVRLFTERDVAQSTDFARMTTPKVNAYKTRNDVIANNTIVMDGDANTVNTGMVAGIMAQQTSGATVMNNAIAILDNDIATDNTLSAGIVYNGSTPTASSIQINNNAYDMSDAVDLVRYIQTDNNANIIAQGSKGEFKNIEQWIAWTGQDKQSVVSNFRDDLTYLGSAPQKLRVKSNPTPIGSVLNNRGVALPTVTNDIDGDTRGAANQRFDIGADEFSGRLYVNDAEIVRFTYPMQYKASIGEFSDAEYTMTNAPVDVKVLVRNNGSIAKSQLPVNIKIYLELPNGTFSTTAELDKTVKVDVPPTDVAEVSFELDVVSGSSSYFIPSTYSKLTGYTVPAKFSQMATNVTPRYKMVVSLQADEVPANNTNLTDKIVRFYVKQSNLSLLVSGENTWQNIGMGYATPTAEELDVMAGKLNFDSVVTNLNRMGWYTLSGEGNYDFDVFDRNSWEPRNVDYSIYRSLIWTDCDNEVLSDYQREDLLNFVASFNGTDKKNLLIGSEEFVRNNSSNAAGIAMLNTIASVSNNGSGTFSPTLGNTITGVSLAKYIVGDIVPTYVTGDADPNGGLMLTNSNGTGVSRIAYYYTNPTGVSQNSKIMGVTNSALSKNVVLLGIDWRHFAQLSSVLRASIDFIEANNGSIVPVELYSFDAEAAGKAVRLNWSTAGEVNLDRFELEKAEVSHTGISAYETINEVKAQGNTSTMTYYGPIADNNVEFGKTYSYRLRLVDADGSYDYSYAKEITLDGGIGLTLSEPMPNPVVNSAELTYTIGAKSQVTINLYDVTGKLVSELVNNELESGAFTLTLNASSLNSGVYTLVMSVGNNTITKNINITK